MTKAKLIESSTIEKDLEFLHTIRKTEAELETLRRALLQGAQAHKSLTNLAESIKETVRVAWRAHDTLVKRLEVLREGDGHTAKEET